MAALAEQIDPAVKAIASISQRLANIYIESLIL